LSHPELDDEEMLLVLRDDQLADEDDQARPRTTRELGIEDSVGDSPLRAMRKTASGALTLRLRILITDFKEEENESL
jgi:hypothetical protein